MLKKAQFKFTHALPDPAKKCFFFNLMKQSTHDFSSGKPRET